jgi:hypothetical protein
VPSLSVREELVKANGRIKELENAVEEMRRLVREGATPKSEYQPPPRRPVPIYKNVPLATDGMNAGVNYSGPPSEAAASAGGSGPSLAGYRRQGDGIYWRDPCGILRGPDGEIVTPRVDQPISPARTPKDQHAIDIIDGIANVHPDE